MRVLVRASQFVCIVAMLSGLTLMPASGQPYRGHGHGPVYRGHGPVYRGGPPPRGHWGGGPGPFVGGALLGLGVGAVVGSMLAPPPPVVYAPPPPGYYAAPPAVYYGY
jgi:hypothetical protein